MCAGVEIGIRNGFKIHRRKAYGFESRPAHHSGLVKEIDMNPTGEQPKMMQDESRELSRWLSTTPDALSHAKEAADIITDASIESSLRMLKADKEQS